MPGFMIEHSYFYVIQLQNLPRSTVGLPVLEYFWQTGVLPSITARPLFINCRNCLELSKPSKHLEPSLFSYFTAANVLLPSFCLVMPYAYEYDFTF